MKKPLPEQLYKTLMKRFIDADELPPCDGYTETFFADGPDWIVRNAEREAKIVCNLCPFKAECLEYALAAQEPYGVWGGTTVAERQVLLKSISSVHAKPTK